MTLRLNLVIVGRNADAVRALDDTQRELQLTADSAQRASAQMTGGFGRARAGVQSISEQLQGLRNLFGGFLSLQFGAHLGAQMVRATMDAERMANTMRFASGSAAALQENTAFLRHTVGSLGLDLKSAGDAFASLSAATRGSALEGDGARSVFDAVARASTVMGLSAETTSGALLALQQMVSKGTVSAEELRGQLGERLPGAFQVAARSIGVTTQQLGKLLEQGALSTDVFLPRFAAQLRTEVAGSMAAAADSVQANLNRVVTEWELMKRALGDSRGISEALGGVQMGLAGIRSAMQGMEGDFWSGWSETVARALAFVAEGANLIWASVRGVKREFKGLYETAQLALERQAALLADASGMSGKPRGATAVNADYERKQQALDAGYEADVQAIYAGLGKFQQAVEVEIAARRDRRAAMDNADARDLRASREYAQQVADVLLLAQPTPSFGGGAKSGERVSEAQKFVEALRREREELALQVATYGQGADAVFAYRASKAGLSAQTQALREALAGERAELQRKIEVDRATKDLATEMRRLRAQEIDALLDSSKAIAGQVSQLEEETARMGLSRAGLRNLQRARDDEALSTARQRLQTALATGARGEELDGITLMVEELERLKRAREDGWKKQDQTDAADAARDAAKDAADEWSKTVASIEGGLTDALMRAFESGKGFADAFRSTLVNAFKTMVLQPTIRAIMAPVAGGLGSLFSGGAAAAGGAAGAGGGGMLGSLAGLGGGLLGASSYATTGTMFSLAGGSLATSLGAAGSLIGSGSIASGAGMAAGALAPYVLGAMAVAALGKKMFGRKLKDQGIEGSFGAGGDFDGNAFKFYKGGWFKSDKTKRSALDPALDTVLDAGGTAAREQIIAYANVLELPASAAENLSHQIKLSFKGLKEDEIKAKLAEAIGGYQEAMAEQYQAALAQYTKAGETALQTMQRLFTLQTFSEGINQLGGVFSRVAGLSVDAREHLIGLAGGLEQLGAQAMGYAQNYYSRDEIAGLKARELSSVLGGVGLDASGLSTRDQFRAMVEGIDVSTEAGRKQLAAALAAQGSFADVADYIASGGSATLGSTAAQAPQSAALGSLFDSAAVKQVEAVGQTNALLRELIEVTKAEAAARAAAAATAAQQTRELVWAPAEVLQGMGP